jgi:hypothetical protein
MVNNNIKTIQFNQRVTLRDFGSVSICCSHHPLDIHPAHPTYHAWLEIRESPNRKRIQHSGDSHTIDLGHT